MLRQKYLSCFFFCLWYPRGSLLIVRSFIYYWLCKTNDHKKREDREPEAKIPRYRCLDICSFSLFLLLCLCLCTLDVISCIKFRSNIVTEVSRQFLLVLFSWRASRSKAVPSEYQVAYLFLLRLFLLFISFLGLSESNEWNVTPSHWWEAWMSRDKQEANVRREASESTTSWFDYRAEVKILVSSVSQFFLSFIWSLPVNRDIILLRQTILCTTLRVLDRDWLIHVCTCFSCRILTHSTLLLTKSVILDEFTSCCHARDPFHVR